MATRKGTAEDLLHIDDLELNGQTVDLNYYFTQEYTDIGQAAQELPNLIEWINAQMQVFYEDKLNAEQELKRAEADAYFDLKNNGTFATLYGGKPTEKSLEHAVNRDEGVLEASQKLNRLAAWVRRLNNLQQSLNTKLDLIRSSEATRRRLVDPAELELDRKTGREERED
jgi:outer membrane murein-binding lipoprotein Lpp